MTMRWLIVTILAIAASCGAPNPDFCCVTEEQCAAAGVTDELRPCDVGQACNASSQCVAQECTTSVDCTSADRPSCQNNLCVEGCTNDDDCAGVQGASHCDAGLGECVGCLSNDQCTVEAAICDDETQSCRGCLADADCGDAVCLEANGTCVTETDVIYLANNGSDTGTCPKTAPCQRLEFALGHVSGTRRVIKLVTTSLSPVNTNALVLDDDVVIDGANAVLSLPQTTGLVVSATVLIEGVTLQGPATGVLLRVLDAGVVTTFDVVVDSGERIEVAGELTLVKTHLNGINLACDVGKLAIRESTIDRSVIEASQCQLEISRSRIGPGNDVFGTEMLRAEDCLLTIENNLFIEDRESVQLTRVVSPQVGSAFSFNTFFHTSVVTNRGASVNCSPDLELSSSIFALNTTNPLGGLCVAHNSLFESLAGAQQGANNMVAEGTSFFADRVGGDLHLAPTSPAKGLGEAGLVDVDLDGNPRPATNPDSGAFEAP